MTETADAKFSAHVIAVQDDIVTIQSDTALIKNEVVYVRPTRTPDDNRQERLKSEVLRVRANQADVQVFESTVGVAVGDPVEQSGELLSVELGPGLLGQVYDGLQNPLEEIAQAHGIFLPRGEELAALDPRRKWNFVPRVHAGEKLLAGGVLGCVQEGVFSHRIMVPFDQVGEVEVLWIQEGQVNIDTRVAILLNADGVEQPVTLKQRWPVRRPLPQRMLEQRINERQYPNEPLITTLRLIDTFFPIARGGTACIPGPFGAGKTVLQHLISRYSSVDIVIIVACGERAGEVVETITEFPQLNDPVTGGSLMDRTIIICNTSSMPVAAREASIYTGITLGEYYRQMGYDVLLLADSTSRWAQAMRETSGRLEEIPGEEAFPAYLDSAIRGVYERAGVVRNSEGDSGSLTMIGTVSPAGGNFEEPVTQSTLNTVKCFLGLSYDRAYKRFYPAVDPLISWSRYQNQLAEWYREHMGEQWPRRVKRLLELFRHGDSVLQMMQVTGVEGITLEDFVTYQKALFLDMVYLQQDAFDEVDASTPLERQKLSLDKVFELVDRSYAFADKDQAQDYFTRFTGLFKNFNYAAANSPDFALFLKEIDVLAKSIQRRE